MRYLPLGLAVLLAGCGGTHASKVEVSNLLAQPVTAARTSAAVYLTITATCTRPDVLEAVSTPAPRQASLVASSDVDVKLVIKPLPSISIACGTATALKPMGQHILVTGIEQPVRIGDRLPLTLRFKDAGEVTATAEITSMGVLENVDPMGMRRHHQSMPGMDMSNGNMH